MLLDDGTGDDIPFPQTCRDAGVNAAFLLVGPLPDDQDLGMQCPWQLDPDPPCPETPIYDHGTHEASCSP
jgi:hypothetical protein